MSARRCMTQPTPTCKEPVLLMETPALHTSRVEPISLCANNALIVAGSRKITFNLRKQSCRKDVLEAVSRLQKARPGPFSLNDLFEEMQLGGSAYRRDTVRRTAMYAMSGRKAGTHPCYQDLILREDGRLDLFRRVD